MESNKINVNTFKAECEATKLNFDNFLEVKKEGWVQTDGSNNQYYKEIVKDKIYVFREERIVDPVTFKTEPYVSVMDIEDYTFAEMLSDCRPFGYDTEDVQKWLNSEEDKNIALILECIFEMES